MQVHLRIGRVLSFHDPAGIQQEMNIDPSPSTRMDPHRPVLGSVGHNYAYEYVHLLNAYLVSCMLPLHSRPSIH
jgi:hypothetical protein